MNENITVKIKVLLEPIKVKLKVLAVEKNYYNINIIDE